MSALDPDDPRIAAVIDHFREWHGVTPGSKEIEMLLHRIDDAWFPIETAPEAPTRPYLAVDCLGYAHKTEHRRSLLMVAGWAHGWRPIKFAPLPPDHRTLRERIMESVATHAREFKRLVVAHKLAPDIVIEGVRIVWKETPDND